MVKRIIYCGVLILGAIYAVTALIRLAVLF